MPATTQSMAHLTHIPTAGFKVDDADHELFLECFGDVIGQFGWICHAYCLMENHYHLLIETPEGSE